MIRFTGLARATLASAVLLSPIVAGAQGVASFYVAAPVAQPANTTIITNSTLWTWRGTAFTASKGPERSNIICELLVKRVGALASFSVGGKAFDADALAKCNARAAK